MIGDGGTRAEGDAGLGFEEGPPTAVDRGEVCRKDGELEWTPGEPEERVDVLNKGRFADGRLMGIALGAGADGSSRPGVLSRRWRMDASEALSTALPRDELLTTDAAEGDVPGNGPTIPGRAV